MIFAINTYKKLVTPLFKSSCRYYPSCSSYSIDAIEKYGPLKGLGMALLRILRCSGYNKGGFDPVDQINASSAHTSVSRETIMASADRPRKNALNLFGSGVKQSKAI